MNEDILTHPVLLILSCFREYAMQLADIVVRFQHKLARYSIPMVDVWSNGYRSNRPLSRYSVPPHLTMPGQGKRGQPLATLLFQAGRYSQMSLIQCSLWIF
jgi:hypothetical protein